MVSDRMVFTFARMNPPTRGHEVLVQKVIETARTQRAEHLIVLSNKQDHKKNPIPAFQKGLIVTAMMYPRYQADVTVADAQRISFIQWASWFETVGYKHLTMVVGSDREEEMRRKLNKYNGREYTFDSIEVVSAGVRDPDAEGVEGASGTKARELAAAGDFEGFDALLPECPGYLSLMTYDLVRQGLRL